MKPPYKIVFCSSLSILAFEITLIRIFSIRFSYHYASLIISISMIGLVLGGIYVYLNSRFTGKFLTFLLSLSYPLVFILSLIMPFDPYRALWENTQILYFALFILSFSIPFFLYGAILSLALSENPQATNRIYASDLIGASLGVILAMFLLNQTKIEYIIVVCSFIPLVPAYFTSTKHVFKIICTVLILVSYIPIINGACAIGISQYKPLMQSLREDGSRLIETIHTSHSRLDIFENPRMKVAPGLSLSYTKPVQKGLGIGIDGDITGVMLDEEKLADYDFFSYLPSALPYVIKQAGNVMVVGFRNSLDILMPYYWGAKNIYVAEKDLSIWRFIHSNYKPDSLYRKSTYPSSARMFINNIQKRFDVIAISRAGFSPSGTFGLQEDYDLTTDALKLYLKHLNEDGFLFIRMFILPPPRYELRMFNNIVHVLNAMQIKDLSGHLIVFRSWDTINFLVSKTPFTEKASGSISTFMNSRQFSMLYPFVGATQEFIIGLDYKTLFENILDAEKNQVFMDNYPFDTGITTDDKPFFHYFLKLKAIKEIYVLSGEKWSYFLFEGMALPFIFLFLLIISVLIFSGTVIYESLSNSSSKTQNLYGSIPTAGGQLKTVFLYFALISFAFMFVEVFFIHKFILPLGAPAASFSAVLVTLLLSSGCGSLLGSFISDRKSLYTMKCAPALLVIYFLIFEYILTSLYGFLFIIPAGLLLGLFFPSGIRLLCKGNKRIIPLVYAANGAASIVAPALASMLAVQYGLKVLLILSFVLYCGALSILVTAEFFKNACKS